MMLAILLLLNWRVERGMQLGIEGQVTEILVYVSFRMCMKMGTQWLVLCEEMVHKCGSFIKVSHCCI